MRRADGILNDHWILFGDDLGRTGDDNRHQWLKKFLIHPSIETGTLVFYHELYNIWRIPCVFYTVLPYDHLYMTTMATVRALRVESVVRVLVGLKFGRSRKLFPPLILVQIIHNWIYNIYLYNLILQTIHHNILWFSR